MKALDEIYKIYTYAFFTHFRTLGLQSKNQQKRFWQASSRLSTRPRRRNHQTVAKQRVAWRVAKRKCTRHAALTVRVRAGLSQKINACDARQKPRWCKYHSAMQEARHATHRTAACPSFNTRSPVSHIGSSKWTKTVSKVSGDVVLECTGRGPFRYNLDFTPNTSEPRDRSVYINGTLGREATRTIPATCV